MPIFMLTDIEGSSEKWERFRETMGEALSRHDAILTESVTSHGGKVIKHTGDGIFAVFGSGNPLGCALAIQSRLQGEEWGELGEIRVRIALHAGQAEQRGEDYYGMAVNRTSRILTAGWGGQILVSPEVKELCALPPSATWLDLGVHLLKDLNDPQQIFQLCHPELRLQTFPELRTLSAHPHNLPPQSTPFLGREAELGELIALVNDPEKRMITILGPGGIGKTRLALQVASETVDRFKYGAYFVPLAPVESTDVLITTIAEALKFSFYLRENPRQQLYNYLREKEILIILDNFEHVIDCAPLVSELLSVAPQIKIMATSRERLNLAGEVLYELRGMKTPSLRSVGDLESYDAVKLFIQNLKRTTPDYNPGGDDLKCIAQICRLLDGLPLGIELAATLMRVMTCFEIYREIEQDYDVLTSSQRDLPDRHRSIRGVFEYSWKLLDEEEKRVFRKLSVFRGSFTKHAAQFIADVGLMALVGLVDKSLLNRFQSGRFSVHGMLRQFTTEKLAADEVETRETNQKHAVYYMSMLKVNEKELQIGNDMERINKIKDEAENLRAAWNWVVDTGNVSLLMESLEGMFEYLSNSSRFGEGRELLNRALERQISLKEKANPILIEKLKARIASIEIEQSEYVKAAKLLNEVYITAKERNDRAELAFILKRLGDMAQLQGDFDTASRHLSESLEIYRSLGDDWNIANILNFLGIIAYRHGELKEATKLYSESREIRTRIGDLMGVAGSLNNLANIAFATGDYHRARILQTESLSIKRDLDNRRGIANSLNGLGNIYLTLGDFLEAEKLYRESLEIYSELGDPRSIATEYNNLGKLAFYRRNNEQALHYYDLSLAIRRRINERFGLAMSLDNIMEVQVETGEYEGAMRSFLECLNLTMQIRSVTMELSVLATYACLLWKHGINEESLKLCYFILEHPATEQVKRDYIRNKFLQPLESVYPIKAREKIAEQARMLQLEGICAEYLAVLGKK